MTPKHSANAVAAKARKRMEGPSPDYPPMLDYEAPVESWTFKDYRRSKIHKLVLFHSRRRRGSFRVMVNGREWSKCIGYDQLIRRTGKALAKCSAILLLLCGCATRPVTTTTAPMPVAAQVRKKAVPFIGPLQIKLITLDWNAGYHEIVTAPPWYVLPKTSGIESTGDFQHWFSETNVPVTVYTQQIRVALPMSEQYQFYRAVDSY